jgi:hypothetical protein
VCRTCADEDQLDAIDREIVARTWWRVLRPNEIARAVTRNFGWRSPVTIRQAAVILAACAEAGYPIIGNGAPDYPYGTVPETADGIPLYPVRGEARDRVLWSCARTWAERAARRLTYVSLGDARGYLPRPVQYDQPGSMHPGQRASLTLGPLADRGDATDSTGYMRRHTRALILVRSEEVIK